MLRAQRPDVDGMDAARMLRGRMAGGIVRAGAVAIALPPLAAFGGLRDAPTSPGLSPPTASTGGGGDADVVMLIRHAEKPVAGGAAQSVTSDGTASATSLTVAGWVRAGVLAALFAPARGTPPSGLSRPTAIWASDPRGEHGQRPQQTVTPLAGRLGVAPRVDDDLTGTGTSVDPTPGIVAHLFLRVHATPPADLEHQQDCRRTRSLSTPAPSTVHWGATALFTRCVFTPVPSIGPPLLGRIMPRYTGMALVHASPISAFHHRHFG